MTEGGKHCVKRRNCTFCAISSFVTVFKKLSAAEASESVYMRERVNTFQYTGTFWVLLQHTTFENVVTRGEIAHDKLPFATMFSTLFNNFKNSH